MNRILSRFGRVIFWLGWPVWVVYFRLVSDRTRVIIVAEDKILLVRTWLGANSWGLPGGGAKKAESLEASACREVLEETSLKIHPDQLEPLGKYFHSGSSLKYTAHYFLVRLGSVQKTKGQIHEIAEVGWFDQDAIKDLDINEDAVHGLKEYRDKIWYNN